MRGFLAVSVALLGAGALAVTAFAGDSVSSEITLSNPSAGTYSGKVTSEKRKCKRKRDVIVYHDENANGDSDSDDFRIGETTTSRAGKYGLTGEEQAPSGDQLVAVALREEKGKTVCKEAVTTAVALKGS